MKTHTQLLKQFFATLLLSILVLIFLNSPALLVFSWASPSSLGFSLSGHELQSHCVYNLKTNKKSITDYQESSACMFFVRGVINTSAYTGHINFCTGEGVTMGQTIRVVMKYMDDHPEQLHFEAVQIVKIALEKAFPCKGE